MKIELTLADKDNFFIVKNFIPLFREYLGYVYDETPNRYGVFDHQECKTLKQSCDKRNRLIDTKDEYLGYIVYVDKIAIGYVVIAKGKQVVVDGCDYFVQALYILRSYRRKGISSHVLKKIFDSFPGKWLLYTSSSHKNKATQAFWRNIIKDYTDNSFTEEKVMIQECSKLRFSFNNSI